LRWGACDPNSGLQRSGQTNEENIDVFRRAFWSTLGYKVPILPGLRNKGCLEHRINNLREYLMVKESGIPDLMIFSNCHITLDEFEDYMWSISRNPDINASERPRAARNHLMNACEYIAERKPGFHKFLFEPRDYQKIDLQYGHIGR